MSKAGKKQVLFDFPISYVLVPCLALGLFFLILNSLNSHAQNQMDMINSQLTTVHSREYLIGLNGQYGDSFGSFNAMFSAFGSILLFATVLIQIIALREDKKASRESLLSQANQITLATINSLTEAKQTEVKSLTNELNALSIMPFVGERNTEIFEITTIQHVNKTAQFMDAAAQNVLPEITESAWSLNGATDGVNRLSRFNKTFQQIAVDMLDIEIMREHAKSLLPFDIQDLSARNKSDNEVVRYSNPNKLVTNCISCSKRCNSKMPHVEELIHRLEMIVESKSNPTS